MADQSLSELFWVYKPEDEEPKALCRLDPSTHPPSYWVLYPGRDWVQNDDLGARIHALGNDDWESCGSQEATRLVSKWHSGGK